MAKIIVEFVNSVLAAVRDEENAAARRGKDIEYIYVFAPRENGAGFCAVSMW